ncbi:hypothetical protein ACR0ST_12280 [Aliidiomarina sp. Khilg15.8]
MPIKLPRLLLIMVVVLSTTTPFLNVAHAETDWSKVERIETKGQRIERNEMEIEARLRALQQDAYSGSNFSRGLGTSQQENEDTPDENCEEGNPTIVLSGTKIERVTDFVGSGRFPLELTRMPEKFTAAYARTPTLGQI